MFAEESEEETGAEHTKARTGRIFLDGPLVLYLSKEFNTEKAYLAIITRRVSETWRLKGHIKPSK